MCQFSVKADNFDFFGPNLPKKEKGFQIQKTKVGIRISILEIPCVPIFSQNGQRLVLRPKFGEIAQLRVIFWFKYC